MSIIQFADLSLVTLNGFSDSSLADPKLLFYNSMSGTPPFDLLSSYLILANQLLCGLNFTEI